MADSASVLIHLDDPSFSSCDAINPNAMDCRSIVVEGDGLASQRAYVFVAGVEDLTGVRFGIEYPPTVAVTGWTLCADGSAIPETGWPVSGKGLAVSWAGTHFPGNAASLSLVGYFTIAPTSLGTMRITDDPRTDALTYTDGELETFAVEPQDRGVASVGGVHPGYNPCGGFPGPLPEPPSAVTHRSGAYGTGTYSSNIYWIDPVVGSSSASITNEEDCDDLSEAPSDVNWESVFAVGGQDSPHTIALIEDGDADVVTYLFDGLAEP